MKIQIDCYGFEATSVHFQKRKLETYLVKQIGDVVYECFGTGKPRVIHRIDKDSEGCVRVSWAYGAWSKAESLYYIPINETMVIEREEV